ncbi:hypothetical protein PI124_g6173 [Phytophthora idaei]|nr:hypothetical protein PI125_g5828 [Phytophthora idaei]KAG3167221.1 hypothetical protein PI126_g3895 [Phytophthora idaei]KAG3249163.1 hypothetical protein PI124_g6173 [Phytophthora idaei]
MWKPGSDRPQDRKSQDTNTSSNTDNAVPMKGDSIPARKAQKAPAKLSQKAPAKLSQKTLAMKFMQRKKTTEAQRIAAVKEQHKQDTWEAEPEDDNQGNDGSKIICMRDVPDPSLPLLFGRRSFGGFNKGVEDEFKEASRALRFAASEEKELRDEVSAEEMTSRMLKYTGLGRRNGGGKRPSGIKRQRK